MRKLLLSTAVFLNIASASADGQVLDSSAAQEYEARATIVSGQVTRIRDAQPWVLGPGERVAITQEITTGKDGYAKFEVAGGSSFELFSNSKVVFRGNAAAAGDLLDVIGGRVRVHFKMTFGQPQQRIFTPVAVITASQQEAVTVAVAIDEDETVRIDVLEGEVRVRHKFLPRGEPTAVRAIDAILVQKDEPISRRVDRGSLYRYALKPLRDAINAVTPGHSGQHNWMAQPAETGRFLAEASPTLQ